MLKYGALQLCGDSTERKQCCKISNLMSHGQPWLAVARHERRMASHDGLWQAMAGHCRPWPVIVGDDQPWPAMTGHGWPWHAMTSHVRPFPGMVGHGWLRPLMLGHCQPWRAMSINGWPRPAGNGQPWPAMVVPCTSSHAALQISMGTLFGITLTIAFRTVHLTINSRLKRLLRIFFAFSA